jgi:hypothetical protein
MNWEDRLISIYFLISETAAETICENTQRMSNHYAPEFSDAEVMTIYLFGIIHRGYHEKKEIYAYTADHLRSWFPKLPKYEAFSYRLNRLVAGFNALANYLLALQTLPEWLTEGRQTLDAIVDSLPIMLAKGHRSKKAKVAKDIADRGFCATKGIMYHGLKAHALNLLVPRHSPKLCNLVFSPASHSDNTVFKEQIAPTAPPHLVVRADRIYDDETAQPFLENAFQLRMEPIKKRKKGQKILDADVKLMNSLNSSDRQPIESFFNWLIQKTGIQDASKVRSSLGLLCHIQAKLAAALIIVVFNF